MMGGLLNLMLAGGCANPATVSPEYGKLSASSVYGNQAIGFSHGTGRLDSAQGWSSDTNTAGQWWQIDLGSVEWIAGVVTQARADQDQYVKS